MQFRAVWEEFPWYAYPARHSYLSVILYKKRGSPFDHPEPSDRLIFPAGSEIQRPQSAKALLDLEREGQSRHCRSVDTPTS